MFLQCVLERAETIRLRNCGNHAWVAQVHEVLIVEGECTLPPADAAAGSGG